MNLQTEASRGSEVRRTRGGHLHYSASAAFIEVPVSVAAATCYSQDLCHRSARLAAATLPSA